MFPQLSVYWVVCIEDEQAMSLSLLYCWRKVCETPFCCLWPLWSRVSLDDFIPVQNTPLSSQLIVALAESFI